MCFLYKLHVESMSQVQVVCNWKLMKHTHTPFLFQRDSLIAFYLTIHQNRSFIKCFLLKGIFSDSNNIFLWHKSEDINKKRLFPKFQLILILRS